MNELQKNIMRRVYYAYALRLATHRNTVHGTVLVGLTAVVMQFVSLNAVFLNLLNVRIGQIDTHFYNAVVNTEVWTLLSLGVFVLLCLSYVRSVAAARARRLAYMARNFQTT